MATQNVAVLGATGSIGTATLDVLQHLDRIDGANQWNLWAASGHANLDLLAKLLDGLHRPPRRVVLSDPESAIHFRSRHATAAMQICTGPDALVEVASDPEVDIVVAAIVGRAGLESTLAAVESGKRVALANKETMVVGGSLVNATLMQSGAELLPIDSEHSAIFQCLGEKSCKPRKLILTASGGPFRSWSAAQMDQATPDSALDHPTWDMGPKITIDSATMMNKALEVIEARWLFDLPAESIEVVVHPQSIIHSMVEFEDGSVIAQLSPPDMRLPIQYALTYPRRLACQVPPLDREQRWDLTLEPADRERFPALDLGFEVAAAGGTAGAVVNAANESAVGLFLEGKIRFTDIVPTCRTCLENHSFEPNPTLETLLRLDRWARKEVAKQANVDRPLRRSGE
ncbi:1-deoxy-D-xylulose-5-phosphate reductoisomerase [Novipirellula artificiosorum]|nr:1-deoxy-D-xylulose-5-phosphate reductoisomerase [Novipirellula artificiosorum]